MPYQIDKTDGTRLVTLADGVVDISTDLQLVGRNVAGYGEIQNENFVKLLENFARADIPPSKALVGQVWFDKNVNKLRPAVFDGVEWRQLSLLEVSTIEPQTRKEGDLWWDSDNNQLYAWTADGDKHILIGPESIKPFGTTRWVTTKLTDTSAVEHPVTIGYIDGTAYVVLADSNFTIDQAVTPLAGFTYIKRGMTLDGTTTTGLTTTTRFHGTASNSERLGDRPANGYAYISDNEDITGDWRFLTDAGIVIGDSQEVSLKVQNTNQPILVNESGTTLRLGVDYVGNTGDKTVVLIDGKSFKPYADNEVNLGAPTVKWRNIYADAIYANVVGDAIGSFTGNVAGNLTGNVTGAVTGAVTGTLKSTSGNVIVDNDATTSTPELDSTAGTVAGRFEGTAKYVDYGVYRNNAQTITGDKTFTGGVTINSSPLVVNSTALLNGTSQHLNSQIKKVKIGNTSGINPASPITLGSRDVVIDTANIEGSEITTTLFKGGELREGTKINGASIGDTIPVQKVVSNIYYDTTGKSFTNISYDDTFANADNTTVMTALAIKNYIDAKVDDVVSDIQFHIDNKDMTVDDVKTQLTRIAPPLEYPEGTRARILGSHYYNNIATDSNGNKRYVIFYGQGITRYGIGYIGGRTTSSNTTSTEVLTAKSGFTGYLFQREAGGTPIVKNEAKNNSSNAGNIVSQITNRTFVGWIEFDNPIPQAVANAFGDPAIVNARVIAVENGIVRDYSSVANTTILYDNTNNYQRALVEDYETTATIGGVGVSFEVYDYSLTTVTTNAQWVFKTYI